MNVKDLAKQYKADWKLDEARSENHIEPIYVCSHCQNNEAWGDTEKTNFCSHCGAPMTKDAMEIVEKRLSTLLAKVERDILNERYFKERL